MLNSLKRLQHFPLPRLLNLPLAALLGYALTRLLLPMPSNAALPPANLKQASSGAAQTQLAAQQLNMQPVLQAHLFGQAARSNPSKAAPVDPIKAPETKLQLSLQGTLLTDNKADAKAIIAAKNGPGKEYTIGTLVPGGARLQDIYVDKVILERQGQLETLSLINETAKAGISMIRSETTARPRKPSSVSNTAPVSQTGQDLSQTLQQYRQRILRNPAEMAQLLYISPAMQQGQFIGYVLRPGKEPQFFQQAGLRSGDILTHLNGSVLDSPMRGLNALRTLEKADFLDLQVLRNGSPMQFSLSLR